MPEPTPRLAADPIAEAHRQWVEHGWADAADGMAAITSLMRAHQIALSRVEAVLRARLGFAARLSAGFAAGW